MRKRIVTGMLGTMVLAGPVLAQSSDNWIMDMQNPACSVEARQIVADSVRGQIESHVGRAEASIQPPAALGDLSCLNDLMNAPLDIFSNIGGLLGSLQGGLSGMIGSVGDLDVSRQVCEFAAEKWAEVTEPLMGSLASFTGAGSDIWDNFDLTRNGGTPGNTSTGTGSWNVPDSDLPPISDDDPEFGTGIPVDANCTAEQRLGGVCRLPEPTPNPDGTVTIPEREDCLPYESITDICRRVTTTTTTAPATTANTTSTTVNDDAVEFPGSTVWNNLTNGGN